MLKMMGCVLLFCSAFLGRVSGQGQDLLKLSAVHIGSGDTELDNEIAFTKYGIDLTIPQRLKSKDFLFHSIKYSNLRVDYEIDPISFTSSELERFDLFSYQLMFLDIRKDRMPIMLVFSPTLSSNFEEDIEFKDIQFYGLFAFMKKYDSGNMLQFGAMYSSSLGFPAPLPYISYNIKWDEKWTANIGFPQMKMAYQASSKNTFSVSMALTGEYMRLGKNLEISYREFNKEVVPIDNVRMQNIGMQFNWEHKLNSYSRFSIGGGYTFHRSFGFYDGNEKQKEFKLNNNLFVAASLSFGFYK